MTVFLTLRSAPSGASFKGENQNDTLLWDVAEQKFYVGPGGGGGGGLVSFNGRTAPAVIPELGDYDSDLIENLSDVAGDTVTEALDELEAQIQAIVPGGEILPLQWSYFVDIASEAPGTPDGSIAHPFVELADAFALAQADINLGRPVVLCFTPAEYIFEPQPDVTLSNASLALCSTLGNFQPQLGPGPSSVRANLPGVACDGGAQLTLTGVRMNGGVSAATAVVAASFSEFAEQLDARVMLFQTCYFYGGVHHFGDDTDECDFVDCYFGRVGTVLAKDAGGFITLTTCTFNDEPVFEFIGAAGVVSMDESTAFYFAEAGGSIVNGTLQVRRAPFSETDEGDAGATPTIDYTAGEPYRLLNVDQNTTITIDAPAPPAARSFTLRLTYGGAFTVAFSNDIKWAGGVMFSPTPGADFDIITFESVAGILAASFAAGGYS